MNGFTVIRTTRSPSIRRIRLRWPGREDAARAVRVPMPRSQFSQMSFQIEPIEGCDRDDCSLSRSSSESLTTARSRAGIASSAIRFASVSGSSSSHSLSLSCPMSVVSDLHVPVSSRSR